jgi:hypothetical protein
MPDNSQPTEVVKLDLSVGSVHTLMVDGVPHVVLKPAIEELGLDFRTQLRKLKTRSWAVVGEQPTTGADGKTYGMKVVPQRTFMMLLATINENNIDPAKRPVLIAFQGETADAIEAYWTKGGAVNPAATEEQLSELQLRIEHQRRQMRMLDAKAEAELLRTLDGHVDGHWLDEELQAVVAVGRGIARQIPEAERTLVPETYFLERGCTRDEAWRHRGQFGKYLKAAFVLEHGAEPPQDVRRINGRDTATHVYYERDRQLFDQVWSRWYAHRLPGQPSVFGDGAA